MAKTVTFKYELGTKVKDKLTGFTGIIGVRCNHITGCDTYGVCPPVDKDGKTQDWAYFDEGRLEIIEENVINTNDVKADRGNGACSNPQGLQ